MALARDRDVQRARQPHAHRPPRLPGAERGDGSVRIGLHFLPPERAAHPQAFHHHVIPRHAEHAGDDLLRFGRMLGRRVDGDEAGLVDPRERRLRLEIEMLLTADPQFAFDAQRTRLDDRRVAVRDREGLVEEAACVNRLLDRQNGRQRLEFDDDPFGAEPRGFDRVAQHPRNRLVIEQHFGRKKRLIVTVRAAVAFAGHVALGEHGDDSGHHRAQATRRC